MNLDEKLVEYARVGDLDRVKKLLSLGVDIHAYDDSALRYASYNGHVGVVEVLLRAGADIHTWNDSALLNAFSNGHFGVVVKLVEAGGSLRVLRGGWSGMFGCEAPRDLVEMSAEEVVGLMLAEAIKRELA